MKKNAKWKARAKSKPLKKVRSVARKIKQPTRANATKARTGGKVLLKRRTKIMARPVAKPVPSKKNVRIMGHGQFTIDARTLKRLNAIDNLLVEMVSSERSDDVEFKKMLGELNQIVMKDGKPVPPTEIVRSDIILPSSDLSVDEARKLFVGEGVIPEI